MSRAVVDFGRCRSGKRYFWAAHRYHGGDGEAVEHGWADTEAQATALAVEAAARLGGDDDAYLFERAGVASETLKRVNRAKRLSRPSHSKENTVVEYLYSTTVYSCGWDGWCGCDRLIGRAKWDYHVRRHPIVKKTPRRVYYRVQPEHPNGPVVSDDDSIGYVDRQQLEAEGKIWTRHSSSRGYLFLNYPDPPPKYLDSHQPSPQDQERLRRLRAEAAAVHPDRPGGDHQRFLAAWRRYEEASTRTTTHKEVP